MARDVNLAEVSRWRIGGHADVVVSPTSSTELQALRAFIDQEGLPSVVIGEATNLLFADEGLRAICIQIGRRMARVKIAGREVEAQAGVWVPALARRIQRAGLTGAEHTCGIPGTLGGLICMNGGSQRKQVGSAIVYVTAVDARGNLLKLSQEACGFKYRTSVFQNNQAVVAAAKLRFPRAPDRAAVRREMLEILRDRSRKFPRKEPNCGSVFKSNPTMYAEIGPPGAAIEKLGLKGYQIGDALVSPRHANFFVNAGQATASDMIRLICEVRDRVHAATGYLMEPEVRMVTPQGHVVQAGSEVSNIV